MPYGDLNDLIRKRASDNLLRDKAFTIAKNLKCHGYQRGFASMIYKFFNKNLLLRVQMNLLEVVLKMKIYQGKS